MTSNTLPDYRRDQLTGLIQRMEEAGEPQENIQTVVNDFKAKYAKSVGGTIVESLKEAVATPVLPLAAAMNVPGADQALGRMVDPVPGRFGLTRPLQQAGEGLGANKEVAVENISQGIGQLEEGIATLPGLRQVPYYAGPLAASVGAIPRAAVGAADLYATGLTPQGLAEQAGSQVLGMGVGKAVKSGYKAAKKASQPLVKWWASKFVPKASRKATMDTITKHPEITKPGYFEENLEPVVAEISQSMSNASTAAKKASSDLLTKYGKRPVSTIANLKSAFTAKLRGLTKSSKLDTEVTKHADVIKNKLANMEATTAAREPRITTPFGMRRSELTEPSDELYQLRDYRNPKSPLNLKTKTVPKKAPLSEVVDLKNVVKSEIDKISGDPAKGKLFDALVDYRKRLDTIIENTPGRSGDLAREARTLWQEKFTSAKEIGKLVGANPDLDPTDAATKAKVVTTLRKAFTSGDETLLKELEKLSPGMAEKVKKLAAASHGSFDEWKSLFPSLGLGTAGYLAYNFPRAAPVLAAVGLGGFAASPRAAGAAVRGAFGGPGAGARAAAIAGKAVRKSAPLFPGLRSKEK